MSFRITFHEVPHHDWVREECERLAGALEEEFPETEKFQVTVGRDGEAYSTHLHVTGKHVSVNAQAESRELRDTLGEAFAKAHTQLRKHHDKVVFGRRREGKGRKTAE